MKEVPDKQKTLSGMTDEIIKLALLCNYLWIVYWPGIKSERLLCYSSVSTWE